MEHIKFSVEQKQYARQVDVIDFLQRIEGFSFKKAGNGYHCDEHDSLFIKSDRMTWFWNSQQISGSNAVDYCMKIKQMTYPDALSTVIGDNVSLNYTHKNLSEKKKEERICVLPHKSSDCKRVLAYLCKTRYLDYNIIKEMIAGDKIFQDDNGNVVFAEYDKNNIPKFACKRSTLSDVKFAGDCMGSDKRYTFSTTGLKNDKLFVFESAIDLLSHATLTNYIMHNPKAWTVYSRLSLSGLSDVALKQYLQDHPDIKQLYFYLDNDINGVKDTIVDGEKVEVPHNHGQAAAQEMKEKYTALGYDVEICTPTANDINDDLITYCNIHDIYSQGQKPQTQTAEVEQVNVLGR